MWVEKELRRPQVHGRRALDLRHRRRRERREGDAPREARNARGRRPRGALREPAWRPSRRDGARRTPASSPTTTSSPCTTFGRAYPEETIAKLAELAQGGAVLDAGCGTGELARRLAPLVERVDAVDVSAAMLAEGRTLPGADAANLRWVHGSIEDAPLDAAVRAGRRRRQRSLVRLAVALPRFRDVLGDEGLLAIVHRDWLRDERLPGAAPARLLASQLEPRLRAARPDRGARAPRALREGRRARLRRRLHGGRRSTRSSTAISR